MSSFVGQQLGSNQERPLTPPEEELRSLRARKLSYREIMDSNMVGILVWHVDGRILEANDAVLQLTGYSRNDLESGRIDWQRMTPPEYAERERQAFRELEETGSCIPFEKEYIRKNGSRVQVLLGGSFFHGQRDEGICFILDNSERKRSERVRRTAELEQANADLLAQVREKEQAQTALRRSEARMRRLMDQSTMPTEIFSPDGHLTQVNKAWERLMGLTLADVREYSLWFDKQLADLGIVDLFRRALDGEAVATPEIPYVISRGIYAGQRRWQSGLMYPIKDEATGAVEEVVVMHQDVTDRKLAEENLQREEHYLRKLLQLQEDDRKLVSCEIHDGFLQDVTAAQLLLDTALPGLAQAAPAAQRLIERASELIRKGMREARQLIGDLRPPLIDDCGLVEAIRGLIAEERGRSGIQIQFFERVNFTRLDSILEGGLFRIVQESLSNAKRHSGSDVVEIWLQQVEHMLRLTVRDEGRGFDPQKVPDDRFGLAGIRRRAQIFGGEATIESYLGEGTTVRVEVPLLPADPSATPAG